MTDNLKDIKNYMTDVQKSCQVLAIMHDVYSQDDRLNEEDKQLHKEAASLVRYLADVEKEYTKLINTNDNQH